VGRSQGASHPQLRRLADTATRVVYVVADDEPASGHRVKPVGPVDGVVVVDGVVAVAAGGCGSCRRGRARGGRAAGCR